MRKILFAILLVASFVLAACGGGASSGRSASGVDPVPPDYAGKTNPLGVGAAAAGADIFAVNCVACHGESGRGDGPAGVAIDPAPGNLVELNKTGSDDFFFWRISEGSAGTSMVPWRGILSEEQIWQVVSYIRTLK